MELENVDWILTDVDVVLGNPTTCMGYGEH